MSFYIMPEGKFTVILKMILESYENMNLLYHLKQVKPNLATETIVEFYKIIVMNDIGSVMPENKREKSLVLSAHLIAHATMSMI